MANLSNKVFEQVIRNFKDLYQQEIYQSAENTAKIKIEPKIIFDKYSNNLKIEIKVGEDNEFCKVKSLPEFFNRFLNKERYKYDNKLEFVHEESAFEEESRPLLKYILKYSEIIKYSNEAANGYEYYTKRLGEDAILISNSYGQSMFLKFNTIIYILDEDGKPVDFEIEYKNYGNLINNKRII